MLRLVWAQVLDRQRTVSSMYELFPNLWRNSKSKKILLFIDENKPSMAIFLIQQAKRANCVREFRNHRGKLGGNLDERLLMWNKLFRCALVSCLAFLQLDLSFVQPFQNRSMSKLSNCFLLSMETWDFRLWDRHEQLPKQRILEFES